jgi:hypothetical protein
LTGSEPLTIVDYKSVSEQLLKLRLPLNHIFLVGHGFKFTNKLEIANNQDIAKLMRILFIQVSPIYTTVEVDIAAACSDTPKGMWLKFGGRGKGMGFRAITANEPPKLFD